MRHFSRLAFIVPAVLLLAGCVGGLLGRGAPPRKKLDIQAILDAAPNGSVLTLDYGEYVLTTGLTVANKHDLTITAPKGTLVMVDDVMEDVLSLEDCDSVHIVNLHMRHVKPLGEYNCEGAVIRMNQCSNMEVKNCELDGCGAIAVAGNGVKELQVTGCYIHNNTWNAFYLSDCRDALITGNRIVHNLDVLTQYDCERIEMRDNQLK
jgi:hypothetical protein